MHKYVNLVDLVMSFQTSIYLLLAKIGVDTAVKEPLTSLEVIEFIYSFASLVDSARAFFRGCSQQIPNARRAKEKKKRPKSSK